MAVVLGMIVADCEPAGTVADGGMIVADCEPAGTEAEGLVDGGSGLQNS